MPVEPVARAWLGVTIVNAVASWRGASLAVTDYVEVGLEPGECTGGLACRALRLAGGDGWRVAWSRSTLGFTGGVKSSSAFTNAVLLAYWRASRREPSPARIAWVNAEAGMVEGVSVTGAADDAYASLLGGVAVVDNRERRLVKRHPPPRGLVAVILRPEGLERLWPPCNPRLLPRAERLSLEAWERAKNGDALEALRLNWEAYRDYLCAPTGPVEAALRAGAEAASITGLGPSYEALVEEEKAGRIAEAWKRLGRVHITRLQDRPACCLEG